MEWQEWLAGAGQGLAWIGSAGTVRTGKERLGGVRKGRHGTVWSGLEWIGPVWQARWGLERPGRFRSVSAGLVRLCSERRGLEWLGTEWQERSGEEPHGMVGHGMVRQEWIDVARRGVVS